MSGYRQGYQDNARIIHRYNEEALCRSANPWLVGILNVLSRVMTESYDVRNK